MGSITYHNSEALNGCPYIYKARIHWREAHSQDIGFPEIRGYTLLDPGLAKPIGCRVAPGELAPAPAGLGRRSQRQLAGKLTLHDQFDKELPERDRFSAQVVYRNIGIYIQRGIESYH